MGDYGYKLIHDIYTQYCDPNVNTPSITEKHKPHKKPFFSLINNSR